MRSKHQLWKGVLLLSAVLLLSTASTAAFDDSFMAEMDEDMDAMQADMDATFADKFGETDYDTTSSYRTSGSVSQDSNTNVVSDSGHSWHDGTTGSDSDQTDETSEDLSNDLADVWSDGTTNTNDDTTSDDSTDTSADTWNDGSSDTTTDSSDDSSNDELDSGTSDGSDDSSDSVSGSLESRTEQYLHQYINDERTQRGLQPLNFDSNLRETARAKSQDMADRDYFSHTSPSGDNFRDLYNSYGVSCRAGGENIARTWFDTSVRTDTGSIVNYDNAEELANGLRRQWMTSQGHRDAILRSRYTRHGLGVEITSNGEVYATEHFC